jgi:1,2-diacylglycerol 3-alpha-glucosyltransferase
MRILIAGQTFYKKNNGQAVFTIHLAEGLAQAGHSVVIAVPSEHGRAYRKPYKGLIIQTVPSLPFNDNVNITAFSKNIVKRTIAEFRPDIIHIQDHYFLSRTVLQVARAYNTLQVGTNHFLPDNLTYNLRIPMWAMKPIHRLMWNNMLEVFNTLHAVTTPTETAVRILRQQQIQVPVQAISCGVNQNRFKPRPKINRAEVRLRYGLDPDKKLFLYVGRVYREKGLDVLMQATSALNRNDIQLAIVGQGSYLNALQTMKQRLSLQQQVIFTGFVSSEDLPLLLNSSDIFVMPSGAELQSIATLEAMSSGLPVLAANARALPELVDHNVNGYLFKLGSVTEAARGIATLADNQEQWARMGAVSLLKALPHSLPNTIERYANLYKNLQAYPNMVRARLTNTSIPKERRAIYPRL